MAGQLADLTVGPLKVVAAVAGDDHTGHVLAAQTAAAPELRKSVLRTFRSQAAQLQAFGDQLFPVL